MAEVEVAETARIPAAQQHNANECELFGELLSVLDFRDVLFDALTRPELHSLRLDTLSRGWVDSYLERYEFSIRPVDMASGASTVNVRASTCRCCVASARSRGAHRAARGDVRPRVCQWRRAAANRGGCDDRGAGVRLAHGHARLVVVSEGVRFESLNLPQGVRIEGRSVTMTKCTSTGRRIHVGDGASLAMEGYRAFGSGGDGVACFGKMEATRCVFEDHSSDGVYVGSREAKLVECVLRNNGEHGLSVYNGKAILKGGTISGNKKHGVIAYQGSKVTVAFGVGVCSRDLRHYHRYLILVDTFQRLRACAEKAFLRRISATTVARRRRALTHASSFAPAPVVVYDGGRRRG